MSYYTKHDKFATFASQRRFEKEVHEKVSKLGNLSDAEVRAHFILKERGSDLIWLGDYKK